VNAGVGPHSHNRDASDKFNILLITTWLIKYNFDCNGVDNLFLFLEIQSSLVIERIKMNDDPEGSKLPYAVA